MKVDSASIKPKRKREPRNQGSSEEHETFGCASANIQRQGTPIGSRWPITEVDVCCFFSFGRFRCCDGRCLCHPLSLRRFRLINFFTHEHLILDWWFNVCQLFVGSSGYFGVLGLRAFPPDSWGWFELYGHGQQLSVGSSCYRFRHSWLHHWVCWVVWSGHVRSLGR